MYLPIIHLKTTPALNIFEVARTKSPKLRTRIQNRSNKTKLPKIKGDLTIHDIPKILPIDFTVSLNLCDMYCTKILRYAPTKV